MKLAVAYHCQDCQEIFARAPRGVCPRCASRKVSAFSWLVKSAAEREAWFDGIHGGARRVTRGTPRPAPRHSCPSTVNRIEPKAA